MFDAFEIRGRATAFHKRFFACGETALAPLPALIRSYGLGCVA